MTLDEAYSLREFMAVTFQQANEILEKVSSRLDSKFPLQGPICSWKSSFASATQAYYLMQNKRLNSLIKASETPWAKEPKSINSHYRIPWLNIDLLQFWTAD